MKLSREFNEEQQARARELALQAMGYPAWLNRKCDGMWQLFWLNVSNQDQGEWVRHVSGRLRQTHANGDDRPQYSVAGQSALPAL